MSSKPVLLPAILLAAEDPSFQASVYASQLHVRLPLNFDVTVLSGSEFFYTQDPFSGHITLHISFPSLVKDILASTHYLTLNVTGKQKAWRSIVKATRQNNLPN